MSDVIIRADNLGKQYQIGARRKGGARYGSLRDDIMQAISAPLRWFNRAAARTEKEDSTIWALKDVSFEIKQGEVVGIIGRNGAGKSTLLKILSRITDPTSGRVRLDGRVGALLEVGTGFHPELTGRENIYLNGAILGMRRTEIVRKFDEIVDFAEIEKFIDTPAKFYSSGMYMRLAFAVAAHLEPEILVVDEVLAVGDAQFQKKCLGKMQSVASEGRTVLFVSHNMDAVQRLCGRGIVLEGGCKVKDTLAFEAVAFYLGEGMSQSVERVWGKADQPPGDDIVRLCSVRFKDQNGMTRFEYDVRDPVTLEIEYEVLKEAQLCISVEFLNEQGGAIMVSFDNYVQGAWNAQELTPPGRYCAQCYIPGDLLTVGQVSLNLRIFSPPGQPNETYHLRVFDVIRFSVSDSKDPGGVRGTYPYHWGSPAVRPRLKWETESIGIGM